MFKKGDKVKCIDVGNEKGGALGYGELVLNNVYEVLLDDRIGSPTTTILNEFGKEFGAYSWRFELVKEKEVSKPSVNWMILNGSMVLNYEGKTVTLAKDDKRYADAYQAIKDGRYSDIPGIVEIERSFNGSGLELKDGIIHADGSPIPTDLNDKILAFKNEGLPYGPLLKFWENLKQNPSFNARKMLFRFLQHNGHPITPDGCFIAYRGVSEDFKDQHSGKFDNKPGSICKMDRALVDDNPENTCSAGLHVACYDYAKGFGPKLVEVKVNPRNVVCVPKDYDGTKMRTCEFEVLSECANIREELVYGDTAEEELEDEYEAELEAEAEAEFEAEQADLEAEQEEFEEAFVKQPNPNYRHSKRGKGGRFVKKNKKGK